MEGTLAEFDRTGPQSDVKERFYKYFQGACTTLQEQIARLESHSLVGSERKEVVDQLLGGISRLSNEVADVTESVPAYDQRVYSQAIKGLREKLQETQSKFEPKKKFQFKSKPKNSAASPTNAGAPSSQTPSTEALKATTTANLPSTPSHTNTKDTPSASSKNYNEELMRPIAGLIRRPSFSQAKNVNISGHTDLHIILSSPASHATASGSLTTLNRCIVDMSVPTTRGAPFAGLALKSIKHSLIIAGQIAGAAHITGVEDSILVVASRQVRMHDCKNVDIYLHCASRPIIEDCSNVRFSPTPEWLRFSGSESVVNHWDQVDDFKWLKAEHSPNWSILPEEQRLTEDIWVAAAEQPGVGIDKILEMVGITDS